MKILITVLLTLATTAYANQKAEVIRDSNGKVTAVDINLPDKNTPGLAQAEEATSTHNPLAVPPGPQTWTLPVNQSSYLIEDALVGVRFTSDYIVMPRGAVVTFKLNFNRTLTFDSMRLRENYINVKVEDSLGNTLFFGNAQNNLVNFSSPVTVAGARGSDRPVFA